MPEQAAGITEQAVIQGPRDGPKFEQDLGNL